MKTYTIEIDADQLAVIVAALTAFDGPTNGVDQEAADDLIELLAAENMVESADGINGLCL